MAEAIARIEAGSAALPSVDALFYFLEDLRRDGYRIDARHIAAAQCLLAEARGEGAESPAARRIKFRLAPLIAKSPSQQEDFYRRFDAWRGAPVAAGRIAPAAPPPAGPASEAVKRDPRRRVIAGAVVAFFALAVVATWYFWPPSPSPPQEETVVPPQEETVVPPGEAVDLPRERFEIAEQVVSPFYAGLKAALAAAPLFAFSAWFFIRWQRRLLLMSRGVILGDAALGSVRLPLKLSDVLFTGPELRASAHDLRKHRYLPTHKLDAWRTVDATARRAGLFTPVYRERPQLPEYVFLIEQNGSNDHLARLFDLAVDRLRDEHVEIQRFYFHTDPRQVQADDRQHSTVPLAELASRTDDHRLFIIATADGFFHPLTGEVESWVQRLEPWRSRTMFSTRPLEQWTVAELRLLEEGFSLATAEASGFAAAGEKIAAGTEEAELLEGVLVMPTPTRLDLFSGGITPADRRPPQQRALVPASLDDAGLIEAIPNAGIANAPELAAKAGRRRLDAAVPALERLCRRFVGFGSERTIPEQLAAVEALAMIGGPRARQAIVRIIVSLVVQGPGLVPAIAAAVHLGADLPTDIALDLLRHPDPRVRASACGCIGTSPAVIPILLELMGDLDPDVRHAAACALGRRGRPEARAALTRLLRKRPSAEVIDAITPIADEECVILLGRIAGTVPDLADAARKALEAIDHPRAAQILLRLQTSSNQDLFSGGITPGDRRPPQQLDLFSEGAAFAEHRSPRARTRQEALAPASLDDAALIEAIPNAGIADAPELATEAGRRQLAAAVPALERLCRRFVGFGSDRTIAEQRAAVEALAMIGGTLARQAIIRIIVSHVVQGPGLVSAIAAAVHLGADLPTDVALDLLRHPDPRVRASACGCIGTSPAVIPILLELMGDLDPVVRIAAACALGRLGRPEARAALTRLLREQPSEAVIDAITPIADEECVILLGRIARTVPDLADAAAFALGRLGRPEARAALTRLLREQPSQAVINAITPIADEECVILLGRIAGTVPDLADAAREALEAIDHPPAAQVLASIPS